MRQEEVNKRAQEEAKCLAHEEAERKVEEECKAWEAVARAKEEAEKKERKEREAKEAAEREEAVKRAAEAVEERADTKRRAIKEWLWEVAGQWLVTVVAPLWVAKPSGQMTMAGPRPWDAGATKGTTMTCKACHHAKVSYSWMKRMARELRKQKWVQRLEEAEETEAIDMDEDKDEEQPHFAVLQHLAEEHQDVLGALMTMLDMLSMDFLKFWANDLKEEEMGKSKGFGGRLHGLRVWSWLAGVPLVEVPN
ncbi:hypothetical protein ID866_12692, partial [Astraeus odoratus]